MKLFWEGLRHYYGSAEVVGITPGPDFVPPVMALEALMADKQNPTVLVGYVGDMDEILIAHADEEEIAGAMDFYFHNWPECSWPNYIFMEVST